MNGWGERCGNANLISIIPALQLKMGYTCVPDEALAKLTELSRAVVYLTNSAGSRFEEPQAPTATK
jgi:2-isopropylmalate synthase